MSDAIELRIDPRERPVGGGTVRRLLPFRKRRGRVGLEQVQQT